MTFTATLQVPAGGLRVPAGARDGWSHGAGFLGSWGDWLILRLVRPQPALLVLCLVMIVLLSTDEGTQAPKIDLPYVLLTYLAGPAYPAHSSSLHHKLEQPPVAARLQTCSGGVAGDQETVMNPPLTGMTILLHRALPLAGPAALAVRVRLPRQSIPNSTTCICAPQLSQLNAPLGTSKEPIAFWLCLGCYSKAS